MSVKKSVDNIRDECNNIEEEIIKPKKAKTYGDPICIIEE